MGRRLLAVKRSIFVFLAAVAVVGVTAGRGGAAPGHRGRELRRFGQRHGRDQRARQYLADRVRCPGTMNASERIFALFPSNVMPKATVEATSPPSIHWNFIKPCYLVTKTILNISRRSHVRLNGRATSALRCTGNNNGLLNTRE